jgi:hypothetical protein
LSTGAMCLVATGAAVIFRLVIMHATMTKLR